MLIGYVRVSKSDGSQTLAPQRDALLAAGVASERIYQDLASGRHDARPGLLACLKALQPGNTLVLWKLDRLGRDLRHLVITAEDLRVRGVGLKVLAGAGAQIDTGQQRVVSGHGAGSDSESGHNADSSVLRLGCTLAIPAIGAESRLKPRLSSPKPA